VIGPYGVNKRGYDMYNKGANILHTIRQFCESDEQWRMILRGLNKEFYHQTVSTDQIENYIDEQLDINLKVFFDQYLRDPRVPTFEYSIQNGILKYKWTNTIEGFHMPLEISAGENKLKIHPTNEIQEMKLNFDDIKIDRDYYVFKSKID
jgi:aminopeptidase N